MPDEIKPKIKHEENEDISSEPIVAGNVKKLSSSADKVLIVLLSALLLAIIGIVLWILQPWKTNLSWSDIKSIFQNQQLVK